MSPADPGDATSAFDRRRVEAVVEVSEPGAAVQVCEVRLTPAGRRAIEVQPGPSLTRKAGGVLLGAWLGLLVVAALGCGGAFAWAVPIEGGTADDPPPPGWCRCP